MQREILIERVCKKYCSFYKPSRSGEDTCLGFLVLGALADSGMTIETQVTAKRASSSAEQTTAQVLCPECGYRAEDCDFAAGREGAPPCGGLVILSLLFEKGALGAAEVAHAASAAADPGQAKHN